MKRIQLLVRLGQIFALSSVMWSSSLPKIVVQDFIVEGRTCIGNGNECAPVKTFDSTMFCRPDEQEGEKVEYVQRTFTVPQGQTVVPQPSEESWRQWQGLTHEIMQLATGVFDLLVPNAYAVDLTASSSIPTVNFDDTDSTPDWRLTANNGGGTKLSIEQVAGNIPLTIEAGAPNNALYIKNVTGNLGLGTSTPLAAIHITRVAAPAVVFEDSSTNPFSWALIGDSQGFRLQNLFSQVPFIIAPTAPASSFVIDSDGTIGFGTGTPLGNGTSIHIAGAATADVFSGVGPNPLTGPAFNFGYSGSSFGRGSGFFNVRPDGSATPPNPSLRFATQNCQRMIIDRNGNVGIGNFGADNNTPPCTGFNPGTSPLSRLHVKGGDIRVEGGSFIDDNVTLNVPDYVFEPDYKLTPLNDLQAYIEKEKHLPEIPSAQEIKQHGVKLGEMQIQLLKKVEELTLYTIQQDKKFMALQDQNQKLAAENIQLQARLSAVEAVIKELGQR